MSAVASGSHLASQEFTEILDASSDGIAKLDRNWVVRYINRRARQILGPGIDPVGKDHWATFPDMVFPGSPFVEHYHRAMDEGISSEFQAFYGDPLDLWVDIKVSAAGDGIIVYFRDVTERKRQEQEQGRLADRLQIALHATKSVGVWDWDIANDLVFADPVFAEAYGVEPTRAAAGFPFAEFARGVAPQDRERVQQEIEEALRTGGEYVSEYRLAPNGGEVRWITARGRCQRSEDGRPMRFHGVTVDISEQKVTEQALLRSEKLATVGRMASSIAHEINNPLEAVTNLLFIVRQDEYLSQRSRDYLETADRELARVAQVTSQTLRFHRQSSAATTVDPQDLIEQILVAYGTRIAQTKITVQRRYAPQLKLTCYEGDIRQILNNLVGNAVAAMRDGGELSLRTRYSTWWPTGEKGVAILIADTGHGMSAETRHRAFEAFFTTKGIHGIGLGLWISRRITHKHRGHVRVRSREGERFCLCSLAAAAACRIGTGRVELTA